MRFILCTLMTCAPLCAFADAPSLAQAQSAATLDMQIQSLKKQRDQETVLAKEAQRDADRSLSRDWLLHRRSMLRYDYLEKRIKELNEQIAKLEKEKAGK